MHDGGLITSFFLIFAGAAVLATAALYTRQPLIVAYVAVGALLGPFGTGLVDDARLLAEIAEIGIIFLLFLLGLDMQPSRLLQMLRKTLLVGIASSLVFAGVGYGIARLFGFDFVDSLLIGAAMMFSSTIIGIKLLPTTVLHHRHTGEVVVSLLLLQDLIAILLLLAIASQDASAALADRPVWLAFAALPLLLVFAFGFVRFVLLPLLARFDAFHEYVFLLSIGWCLAMSVGAAWAGLSLEIGAFVAGVAVATSPIAQYIAVSLRPLRDFFLVLFFFSVGAGFDLSMLEAVLLPTLCLTAAMLAVKPLVFRLLLQRIDEQNILAGEVGFRLGQISEFSLLVAYLAEGAGLLGREASTLIQATAIGTFLVSSYLVVMRYPTPIAVSPHLRRN